MAHRADANDANSMARAFAPSLGLAFLFVAVVVAILMAAIFYPGNQGRVGDTNTAGPHVKTVKTIRVPATSPASPDPTTKSQ